MVPWNDMCFLSLNFHFVLIDRDDYSLKSTLFKIWVIHQKDFPTSIFSIQFCLLKFFSCIVNKITVTSSTQFLSQTV